MLSDTRPGPGWVIMADPGGSGFCLEPGPAEIAALEAAEEAAGG